MYSNDEVNHGFQSIVNVHKAHAILWAVPPLWKGIKPVQHWCSDLLQRMRLGQIGHASFEGHSHFFGPDMSLVHLSPYLFIPICLLVFGPIDPKYKI